MSCFVNNNFLRMKSTDMDPDKTSFKLFENLYVRGNLFFCMRNK